MSRAQTVPDLKVPVMRSPAPDEAHDARSDEPDRARRRAVAAYRTQQTRHPYRVAALISAVCLALTGLSTWAAARVDANAEQRLLEVQTKQAAAVLSTAILLIQAPLSTALSVQQVAGPTDTAAFRQLMAPSVGQGKSFVSASLWQRHGTHLTRLANVGVAPALPSDGPALQSYLRRAFSKHTFTVESVHTPAPGRIAYAEADPRTGYVVYAERAIPADRRSPVDRDSAFADLHYAIYLGARPDLSTLSTTDVDPASLPLTGHTARATLPFGDTVLTLVSSPRRHLGASLSQRLPLMLLLGGLLLTLIAGRTGEQFARRRQSAEADATTVAELYDRVEILYGQQRDLSVRLQKALLPHVIPAVPQLEIAAEYVAGAQGVDIGGDWYSIIGLGEDHFAFVVGDVSGRGIDAVAVMAHARFTVRAYLLDGDSPAVALEKCSHQFDITVDGHITTAIVGVGNWRTGEITLACAGHPAPLLLTGDGARYVEVAPGPPLGTGPTAYPSTSFTMTPGSTLFCFTDGLIERRNEDIDTGMERLATTLAGRPTTPVVELVAHALGSLRSDDAPDDIAILALRWEPVR
ncbi:MAG: Serine phosphatase RsbU, regulator of sigma subunit [Marmoricola sp.]|nr:Serine phosphatase RsbU, regulator of sigma subunit [Marmoricola sp.]